MVVKARKLKGTNDEAGRVFEFINGAGKVVAVINISEDGSIFPWTSDGDIFISKSDYAESNITAVSERNHVFAPRKDSIWRLR